MPSANNNIVKENEQDIEDEITELENLIKKLQVEIVQMSEAANKPLPYSPFSRKEEILDDATKSSKTNLEIAEKTIEDISSKLSKAFDYCIMHPSLESDKSVSRNIIIESTMESSNEFTSDTAEISRCHNVSEFFAESNDKDTVNDTCSDDKESISDIKLPGDSIGNDDNSRTINMNITNVPVMFDTETPNNLPDSDISKRNEDIIDARIPEESIKGLPKPDTVGALKETIMKTSENALADNTLTTELSIEFSFPTPTDIPVTKTQSISRENAIPKSDSILKCINRKFRKIVGIGSEKSISRDTNNAENTYIIDQSKAFPRSKSESKRGESSLNNPLNKVMVLTQESFKNASKDFSVKAEAKNLLDSATAASPSESSSRNKNFVQANLTTMDNTFKTINSSNGPEIVNIDNVVDRPDVTKKNVDQGLDVPSRSGATGSIIPDLPTTDEQANTIMKAEVKNDLEKEEEDTENEQEQEDYEDTEERDDDDDDDENEEGDEDDDANTYDVD
ncbi:hypothetical protein PYW07_011029 [Mythimna separata]|uniref:Uncharacterized protein n=1 Tax=Mythimna separata TaxID=271217 RepID=A0AAD7Y747_MYTSE|nr:hypothetical protein PYW07_011029 [Mythimna separata]